MLLEFYCPTTRFNESCIFSSLLRSNIVPGFVLAEQNLSGPLPLQRLYSSEIQGRQAFFEYLKRATTDFTRKLIIIKVG